MAKRFLNYSGLGHFLDKVRKWANGAFAVKSVNGVDLHSMVVDTTNNATFGSMSGKNIQQLRDAIDMWHAENAGKENASLKFSANNNFIGLWNENNLEQTLSSGTTWTLTATNNITTEHSTFQLSTYSNGHELYTIKKLNGVWQSIEKVAKNKSISKSASNKGVSVALGGTVESPTISVTTTTSGVTSNNTGVVSGAEVKIYVDNFKNDLENGDVTVGQATNANQLGNLQAADYAQKTDTISASNSSNGVMVTLGGTLSKPTVSVSVNGGTITDGSSSIVSANDVYDYVKNEITSQATFTESKKGLVPAPSSANAQKYLRGDGTWQTPVSVINNLASTSTTGALSAAQGKILNEKFGVGVYDLGAFFNYNNGCLIELGELTPATMVTMHITGYAYYSAKPYDSLFVFYDWVNNSNEREIIYYGGLNLGYPLGLMKVYHYNNKIYVWIKQTGGFQTLSFRVHSNRTDLSPTVTNSIIHTSGVTLLTEIEPENPLSAATESTDGLMSADDKTKLNTIKTWYDNIVGVDEDKVINKWDEIVSFLSGIPEGDTLDGLIEAVKTQVGDLKDDIEDGTVIAKESKTLGHETIGSTTNPIYLTSGVATPCTYTLGTSVPSNAKFTDTNTTYSFAGGTNKFTVTPSGGNSTDINITPSIDNNVTYSGTLTSGQVAVLDGTEGKIKASGYTIAKSVPSNAVFTDTTYSGMSADEASSGSSTTNRLISPKVLQDKIDSEISAIPVMTGATSTTTGVAGFVPAPASGQQKKYLRGDGVWSNAFLYKSAYNYRNGCLVKTDIGYREIAQCQFVIKGNSYYSKVGIFTFGQFYNYVEPSQESITFGAATMCGFDFGKIYVFHYNNVVYLWFSQPPTTDGGDAFMTFEVYVSTQTNQENRVVEITHSQKPTSGVTKEITITPVARLGTKSIGDATQPMCLLNGIPKECTYTIQKSVPSDAVFTDTHYTAKNVVSNSASSTANVAASNGEVFINLVENNTCRSGINIIGSGATQVVSDEWGNITITSDDTNTTYVAATQGAAGLMSATDKKKLDGIANSANAYFLPNATTTTLGGVKIGSNISVNSGTISLTKSNVTSALGYTPPASDTNTTYSAGSGLSLSGTSFSLKTGYTTSGKNYAVKLDSSGNPYVNVPWTDTDTNTTYNVVTSSVAGLAPKIGTAAAATIGTQSTEWVLTTTSGGTPSWRKLPANAFNNTTYSVATTSANGLMSSADKEKLDGALSSSENVSLSNGKTVEVNNYGTRFYTLSGSGLKLRLTAESGGWSLNPFILSTPTITCNLLGVFGNKNDLTYIYIGGTYSAPWLKFTYADHTATFETQPKVGSSEYLTKSSTVKNISVVNSLPSSPDSNTLYIIK